ncbi:MAG: tetratricopeptide repeat protein [Acidobacteria bacterium]|nr:tetratricopeptide repeat protein [Acidobacteriota bacterium]
MVALREKAILLAAALAAFGASLAGPFHLDDYSILSDPVLTSPAGWREVWRPLRTRPLTQFTFWLNCQLGGTHPWGYHAVNLALHLGVAVLAFEALARRLPRRAALAAAVLVGVHPVQAEAVNYIFARGTLLATLLCLASLACWLSGRRWTAVAWFAAALAAKEECVAFPLALLLLDRRNLAPIAAMLALAAAAGTRVLWAAGAIPGAGAGAGSAVAALDYFAAQGVVILRYLRLFVIPWGFTIDPQMAPVPAGVAALAWLALAAVAFALRKQAWFLAGLLLLLPSSSVFPASDLAADRRLYLPLIAFGAAAAVPLSRVRWIWLAPPVLLLTALSAHRTWVWMSEERLWEEGVDRAPGKTRPRIQLARAAGGARAERLLREAKAMAPGDPAPAAELGRLYLETDRPGEALAEFGRALALEPNDPKGLNNRGAALAALGQREAARADFERALERDPCLFDARLNLRRLGAGQPPPGYCRFTPDQARALR